MDAHYVRQARLALNDAMAALTRTQDNLARAGDAAAQIKDTQSIVNRIRHQQDVLTLFLRDGVARDV